jgi:hypothetical protein
MGIVSSILKDASAKFISLSDVCSLDKDLLHPLDVIIQHAANSTMSMRSFHEDFRSVCITKKLNVIIDAVKKLLSI